MAFTLLMRLLPVLAAVFLFLPFSLSADSVDVSRIYERPIFVGHLDFDCVEDTVVAWATGSSQEFLPDRIVWGDDDLIECSGLVDSLRVPITYLRYPDLDARHGGVAIFPYNQDSLADLLVHYRGRVRDTVIVQDTSGADTNVYWRDTAFTVALFGQDHLRLLDTAYVGLTDSLQTEPFFGLKVLRAYHLSDSSHVDYTDFPSYRLPPVFVEVDSSTQGPSILMLTSVADKARESALRMQIYPNPTSGITRIQLRPLPPGDYSVAVVRLDGSGVIRERTDVPESGELFTMLDLSDLSSGHYSVVVESAGRTIASYPIVVLR